MITSSPNEESQGTPRKRKPMMRKVYLPYAPTYASGCVAEMNIKLFVCTCRSPPLIVIARSTNKKIRMYPWYDIYNYMMTCWLMCTWYRYHISHHGTNHHNISTPRADIVYPKAVLINTAVSRIKPKKAFPHKQHNKRVFPTRARDR